MTPQRINLCGLIEECSATTRAHWSHAEVTLDCPPDLCVYGDRRRLSRLFATLLGNAAKYAPRGTHIAVRVRAHGSMAVIVVRDSGVGIPAAERERVFERGYHAATAAPRTGAGMGLYGCRYIARAHGGGIELADPAEGHGTVVYVRLPLDRGAAVPTGPGWAFGAMDASTDTDTGTGGTS